MARRDVARYAKRPSIFVLQAMRIVYDPVESWM